MTEICTRCRKPIRSPIQRNELPSGSVMHNDCFRLYEEEIQRFHEAIDGMDKIHSVEFEYDTTQLREDSKLRKPEDFSDQAFYASIEKTMKTSNATTYKISLTMNFKDVPTGEVVTLIVKRRGDIYKYRYKNVFGYLKPMFPGFKKYHAILHYFFNRKFKNEVQGYLRELFWRNTTAW